MAEAAVQHIQDLKWETNLTSVFILSCFPPNGISGSFHLVYLDLHDNLFITALTGTHNLILSQICKDFLAQLIS